MMSDFTASDKVLSISWRIATRPSLYKELAANPYSQKTTQIGSDFFPDSEPADIQKAIVLAEPEGMYDRYFKLLPPWLKVAEQEKQTQLNKEIDQLLNEYYRQNYQELEKLTKDFLYDLFFVTVFKTVNLQETEQRFSQKQRVDYKLLIVNLVEKMKETVTDDIPKLKIEAEVRKTSKKLPKFLPSKKSLKIVAYASPTLLLMIFLVGSFLGVSNSSVQIPGNILGLQAPQKTPQFPVRLQIPSINVDAGVENMGVNSKGEMEVPKDVVNVGWYKFGPHPGENGNAVISGHSVGKKDQFGVFNNLDKLTSGDKIYVVNGLGTKVSFVVREVRIYNPGFADEVFWPNDDGTHLNLVTCDGTWDKAQKSYSKRLVVFADTI